MRGRGIDTPRLQKFFLLLFMYLSFFSLSLYLWFALDLGMSGLNWYFMREEEIKDLHRPGIEPGPPAWQASILPLNQRCWLEKKQYTSAGECPCSNVRFVLNVTKPKIMSRSRQDSNLRSQRETDF